MLNKMGMKPMSRVLQSVSWATSTPSFTLNQRILRAYLAPLENTNGGGRLSIASRLNAMEMKIRSVEHLYQQRPFPGKDLQRASS